MKNKIYLKKYLINSVIVVFIFLFVFLILDIYEYKRYKINFNYKINGLIAEIKDKYPDVSDEDIVSTLNSELSSNNILLEYGIDIEEDSLIKKNDSDNKMFLVIDLSLIFVFCLFLICLFILYNAKKDKEINKIIRCIENINKKNYELNIDDISEDELSILKNEIYKTTIMLKEQAENSLKDKVNLKNSLEDISHQLKTPLTSILIILDNLIDDPDMDKEVREDFIRDIKREITNINFLVQNLLKLSKFEASTIEFIRKEVDVKKIVDSSIKNVSSLCDLKNIDIVVKCNSSRKIRCDYRWQVEAITNILKNAVEHSFDKVIIEINTNNLYSEIKIIDFGNGMDKEDRKNIFKRFYKGKNSLEDSIGIGLSLSKVIIENDNGRVSVLDNEKKGTIFSIKYYVHK